MENVTCPQCKGEKTYLQGTRTYPTDCDNCDGYGTVTPQDPLDLDELLSKVNSHCDLEDSLAYSDFRRLVMEVKASRALIDLLIHEVADHDQIVLHLTQLRKSRSGEV